MTNEEKAREIAIEIEKNSSFLSGFGKEGIVIEELKNAAMKMAAWKEEQFNEEKKELLGLVNMLKIDETNQTIIEDLKAMLQ